MSEPFAALETHREILLRLTALVQRDPARAFPSENDAMCRFCGLHPRQGNLCESCEARRVRLAQHFPDVPPPIPEPHAPTTIQRSESTMTKLGTVARPEWMPYADK